MIGHCSAADALFRRHGTAGGFWLLIAASIGTPAAAQARLVPCDAVKDARIVAADGTYLGSLSDANRADSLLNPLGPYDSKSAYHGLWNAQGPYGSASSDKSPMNAHGGKPASILKNGQPIGKLMRGSLRSWFEDPARLVYRCYGYVP